MGIQKIANSKQASTLRILLADDQVWLRSAIRLLLEQDPDVEIVGEIADVYALFATAESQQPNVVLLDWELPGLASGYQGAGKRRQTLLKLRQRWPQLYVIVMSGRPEAGRSALSAGADCFVSKAEPPEALLAALNHAKRVE